MSERRPSARPGNATNRRPANGRPNGRPSGSAPRRPAPRRHANGRFFAFLAIVILIVLAVVLVVWKPWARSADIPAGPAATAAATIAPSPDGPATTSIGASALAALLSAEESEIAGLSAEDMVQVEDLSVTSGLPAEWKNILLIGTDQRELGESSRSDTMIVCSINTTSGEIKLTSLARDTAVDFTDLGEHNGTYRLNAANYFGGPQLAMKTINELLALNIESYVSVNFYGFTQMAEALGGIEMDITEAEMHQINKNAMNQAGMAYNRGIDESNLLHTNVLLEEYGENVHLNGRQALAYARIRKIDTDWERNNRQRKVLAAFVDKMRGKNAFELGALGAGMMQYISTNLTLTDIVEIANTVLNSDMTTIETLQLPKNKTYQQETRNNQSMLYDVDWTTNRLELKDFIYY